MEKQKMFCPICTEKMNLENHSFICHHCGYTINEKTKSNSSIINKIHFNYTNNHPSAAPQRKIKKTGSLNISPIKVIILLYLFASLLYSFFEIQKSNDTSSDFISEKTWDTESEESTSLTNQNLLPKSSYFIEFAEQVFQKKLSDIHPEELAQITSIHIYQDDHYKRIIAYTLNEVEEGIVSFPYIPDSDYSDLSCFTGLKILNIEEDSMIIRKGDFDRLVNLIEIHSDKTLSELADLLPAPEKLQTIAINNSFFLTSLKGIEFFPNLTSLLIDNCRLKTLDGLELLPSLKELSLLDSNQIEDFSALYKLSKLEYLSIESSALRDISFIEKMPNLTSLAIKDAEILQIQSLSYCAASLQSLSLWHTYKIEDYSVLDTLSELTFLQVELPYNYPSISFSHMKELKTLSLGRAGDIRSVATAPHLKILTLDSCNGEHLSALTELYELEKLEISSLSGYFIDLEPLKKLNSLQQLILEDCRIYANIEEVLALPNLKEFTLENCSIGFDFNNLPKNNNLEILRLKNTTFAKILSREQPDYGKIKKETAWKLSDYTDTLKNFPNLIELSLTGSELDHITFAAELKKLQKLDITNNYVTDLTPLSELTELQIILCPNNPIAYKEGIRAKIIQ